MHSLMNIYLYIFMFNPLSPLKTRENLPLPASNPSVKDLLTYPERNRVLPVAHFIAQRIYAQALRKTPHPTHPTHNPLPPTGGTVCVQCTRSVPQNSLPSECDVNERWMMPIVGSPTTKTATATVNRRRRSSYSNWIPKKGGKGAKNPSSLMFRKESEYQDVRIRTTCSFLGTGKKQMPKRGIFLKM